MRECDEAKMNSCDKSPVDSLDIGHEFAGSAAVAPSCVPLCPFAPLSFRVNCLIASSPHHTLALYFPPLKGVRELAAD